MPNQELKRRGFAVLTLALVLIVIDVFLLRAKTGPIALLILLTVISLGYSGWLFWKAKNG